jgi:D-alanyl-D-alanine dipeptidase
MRSLLLLIAPLLATSVSTAVAVIPLPEDCRQMLLVTTAEWSAYQGRLQRFERAASGQWRRLGEPMKAQVGSNGLAPGIGLSRIEFRGPPTEKREGDRRAPAGIFRLTSVFGHETWRNVPPPRTDFRIITPTLEAVDDPKSRYYNQVVDRSRIAGPDWNSSEKMSTFPEYAAGIVIAHNPANVPGAGSCIFLHLWRGDRRGTAGCTVLRDDDLRTLLAWLKLSAKPVLVQLPVAEATRLGFKP